MKNCNTCNKLLDSKVCLFCGKVECSSCRLSCRYQCRTVPDAECVMCGSMYFSGEGHPDRPICTSCR